MLFYNSDIAVRGPVASDEIGQKPAYLFKCGLVCSVNNSSNSTVNPPHYNGAWCDNLEGVSSKSSKSKIEEVHHRQKRSPKKMATQSIR